MDVVLVHGAWADGSTWYPVLRRLQDNGHRVIAVHLPLTSFEADVEATRRAIAGVDAAVVVGHSYGGCVISAAAGTPAVKALVFVAAYAPFPGETVASMSSAAEEMPGGSAITYGEDGWTSVDPDAYGTALGHDLPRTLQNALAALQAPTHVSCFLASSAQAAWEDLPCYYVVSRDDRILSPNLQHAFAARTRARTSEIDGSHLALLSQADTVAAVIETAVAEQGFAD